jgi:hypothetical protein
MSDSYKTSSEQSAPIGPTADRGRDLRIATLIALLLASALFGALLAFGLAASAGFAPLPLAAKAAALAAICILIGSAHGLFVLVVAARQSIERLPMLIVASGLIRMFVALAVALAIYLILNPEGKTFWASFLLAGLLSLLVETSWGLSAMRRVFPAAPASPSRDSGVHA